MPTFRNVSFEDITCDDVTTGITIDNVPGGVMENIYFKNVKMTADTCFTADSVNGLYLENVVLVEKPKA
jgi:polygalacturonase